MLLKLILGRHDRDRMVFRSTTTYAISGGFRGGVRGVRGVRPPPPKIRKAYVIQR
jgi:hypothetical protein